MQPDNLAFNCNTPVGIQNKVWFDIMYHLCRRGQENLRDMKKSTFTDKTDACGREYVSQAIDEADKNHGCDTGPDDTVGEGRMYAQPGSVMCPVKSFKDYLAKLSPDLNELWQRPRDSFNPNDTIWFCKYPLGKNSLAKMMSTISTMAGLSTRYTNHCIRATCISILDRAGFEARHIIRASGHKSEQSVKSYACRLTEETKRKMSDALSTTISPQNTCSYTSNTGPDAVNIPLNPLPDLTAEELNIIFSSENDFQDLANQQIELQNNNDQVTRMNNAQFLNVPQHGLYHINPTMQNCEVHFHFNEK